MKRIVLAGMAAMLPLTAVADSNVELYGDIELGMFLNRTLIGAGRSTATQLDDTGSSIGLTGKEDLGGGLGVIWQIESDFSADGTDINGSGVLASSDTFLGLQGSWGKVRFGNISTYLNSDMETMDPWTYSTGVGGLALMTRFDGMLGNAIRYDSPEIHGFDFSLMTSFDEGKDHHISAWAFGAGYTHEAWFAKVGGVLFRDQNDSGSTGRYIRLEGGLDDGQLAVIGAVQISRQYGEAATGETGNIWGRAGDTLTLNDDDKLQTFELALTASYQMGAFVPHASVAWGNDAKLNGDKLDDSGYLQFVIGSDYILSQRTKAYATLGYVRYDGKEYTDGDNKNEVTFGIGMKHTF